MTGHGQPWSPVTRYPEDHPRTGSAAAPHALPTAAPPGGRGAAAPPHTAAHTGSTRPDPASLLAARLVDADLTPVWQHYGQACVRCGRLFDPDEHPDIDAPAIPGQRSVQRRCATGRRTECRPHRPYPTPDRGGST